MGPRTIALTLAWLLTACCDDTLQRQAAAEYRCVQTHVTVISEDDHAIDGHTHTAIVDVCGTEHTYRRDAGNTWSEIAATTGGESLGVRRVACEGGFELRIDAESEGTRVRWSANPARDPEHVTITIAAAPRCDMRALIDGELASLGATSVSSDPPGVSATTGVAFVAHLAASRRASIRACDDEIRIGETERALLRELLARIDEERRW